jgi:hypothetical protein
MIAGLLSFWWGRGEADPPPAAKDDKGGWSAAKRDRSG